MESLEPYEYVNSFVENPFVHEKKLTVIAAQAQKHGIRNFKKLYQEYRRSISKATTLSALNLTSFTGQPLELDSGEWTADDMGIYRVSFNTTEEACCHPIMPTERLVNIDTGIEKLKIAFSKGKRWREFIADKKTLASNNSILALADLGVAVTSENAKSLVKYISDVENINYNIIPEKNSIGRLGYIPEEGFSPYVDELVFDGELCYKHIFESVKERGDFEKWRDKLSEVRSYSPIARIVIAAAFASPLISVCGAQPFFVHMWSVDSGTGKTVALMLAASVWGTPELGRYIQTFNSTGVGQEKLAAFLNHLPMMIDELQLAKDSRGNIKFEVYQLAEGVGRTRGTKSGGIEKTPTWSNTIITTGETPITSTGSGAGAKNRVIELECKASDQVVKDGHGVVEVIKRNYGHAGKRFVEKLYSDDLTQEVVRGIFKENFSLFSASDTTEKQAMAAAVIMTADKLADEWVFKDGNSLNPDELSRFLATKTEVSAGERGYLYICDWVGQNSNKFISSQNSPTYSDVYGVIDDRTTGAEWAYIISSVFRKAAEDGGFNSAALLSYLKTRGLIDVRGRRNTRGKRINGVIAECVKMRMPHEDDVDEREISSDDDLEF